MCIRDRAFTVTKDKDNVTFTVENHPISGVTIKEDGTLYVSIATNLGFISGKKNISDHKSQGYEFEETDYNPNYTNYKKLQDYMGNPTNDNDEFMWSANFVETTKMSELTEMCIRDRPQSDRPNENLSQNNRLQDI